MENRYTVPMVVDVLATDLSHKVELRRRRLFGIEIMLKALDVLHMYVGFVLLLAPQ